MEAAPLRAQKKKKGRRRWEKHHIPHRPFKRLVRELLCELRPDTSVIRLDGQSMLALQDATEAFAMRLLERSGRCALHARRLTIQMGDLALSDTQTAHAIPMGGLLFSLDVGDFV